MAQEFDLIIRGGTIVDGSGGAAFEGDVAILGSKIAAVGKVSGSGKEEIDAKGKVVTPGFIDIHTHYDGQAIWSERLTPSSQHGVTTVVTGNCGVGFAPCRPEDHELLVHVMEGVEDIPEVVMTEGLDWDWETYPEYLDALDARPHDIDIAAYLPHSALRVYVMGERGANREAATVEDLDTMKKLSREAAEAGAIGFATSRVFIQRTRDGKNIPSYEASETELAAIVDGVKEAGRGGALQFVLGSTPEFDAVTEVAMVRRLVERSGCSASFTYGQDTKNPEGWRRVFKLLDELTEAGFLIRAQILPRPTGMMYGHNLSANPFCMCPTYQVLNKLPLAQKLVELRKPEVRAQILGERPNDAVPLLMLAQNFEYMFPLDPHSPNYEPPMETSIAAQARTRGVDVRELAYDLLLEHDGNAMFYVALGNYGYGNLDTSYEMLREKSAVIGLGDGGAHYGMICDASYPTFVLTHWTRDRPRGQKLSLTQAVHLLARKPGETVGLLDRGLLTNGHKADVNVIDYDGLTLATPYIAYDLPAGGRRLSQSCSGITATIVSGKVIYRDNVATCELPGRVVRGQTNGFTAT